jgi:serine/threonine protein kinase
MQKLALAGNRIKHLPVEMADLKNLELIRISANLLIELPSWILELPKLSWIAFAGNPVGEVEQVSHSLSAIDWNHLDIQDQLGQGASGIISKAILQDEEVAVKVFKGDMTSDGLPLNEKNATMAAGAHPNLVKVLGKIINHPDDKKGLVLGLIPPSYKNLGNPPNYETCSRDTFNENTFFSAQEILKIAKGIASVVKHLHSLGINHGDLYAHNIMYDEYANNLLGDFGAATFYNIKAKEAEAIEKIEVRAFGCLLDDMLMHNNEVENHSIIQSLGGLRNICLQENILDRPNFESICKQLENINS